MSSKGKKGAAFQSKFKTNTSFDDRVQQFKLVKETYPNKIPLIVERDPSSRLPELERPKFLIPGDLTVAQFANTLRKNMNLGQEEALIVYINGTLQAASAIFSTIYEEHKDKDGFLYAVYTGEASFGCVK